MRADISPWQLCALARAFRLPLMRSYGGFYARSNAFQGDWPEGAATRYPHGQCTLEQRDTPFLQNRAKVGLRGRGRIKSAAEVDIGPEVA